MTVRHISFKFLPLLLLFYMNYPPITCQNCGLPRTIRVSERLNESLDTGQSILPPISVKNVVNLSKVHYNPGNFAKVVFIPKTESSDAQLALEVATPYWQSPGTSYVDEKRLTEMWVSIELECSDGRHKEVQIVIPITDENTDTPRFESSSYELTTEPCTQDRCVLTFDKDIKVIDKDRDKDNAGIYLWTNVPNIINFLHGYSVLEHWYVEKFGKLEQKGYQLRTKLEYIPEKNKIHPRSMNFTIYANNTANRTDGLKVESESTVIIHFEENPHRMTAPVFTYPMYHAHVEYDGDQVYTKPGNIFAYVPGKEDNDRDIEYIIEGEPDVFRIDGQGDLSFIKDFGVWKPLWILGSARRVDYNVTAVRTKVAEDGSMSVNTTVPLIVFFHEACSDIPSTTSPTTEPPKCETGSTPWPGICPSPICPDPTPCPETTTSPSTTEEQPVTEVSTVPTTVNPPPTTEMPPSTTESSTPFYPTRPPSDCSCECSQFSCKNPQTQPSLNSTYYMLYPDPYNCTQYHRCPNPEGGPVNEDDEQTFNCQTGTVFCPIMSACTTVEMCLNRTFHYTPPTWPRKGGYGGGDGEEDACHECECIESGLSPGHPDNVCNADNYNQPIPDEHFCDVFHQCQVVDEEHSSYIDYSKRCQPGLVFCPHRGECAYHDDFECTCQSGKIFKQCDVCEMGKWEGFDIFTKRFV